MTVTVLPQSRPLTAADLETRPDDGHRYELIDGALIVTPSPAVPHQRIVGNLHLLLRQACTAPFEVTLAPLDVTVFDVTVVQPDLLVAPRQTLTGRKMAGLPVPAVEVLSPGTRPIDLNLKRAAYEGFGTASYWVVDPAGPRVLVWKLGSQGYGEPLEAVGDRALELTHPFPLSIVPAELAG